MVQPVYLSVMNIDGVFGGLDSSVGRLLNAETPGDDDRRGRVDDAGSVGQDDSVEIRRSPEAFISITRRIATQAVRYEACCTDENNDEKE